MEQASSETKKHAFSTRLKVFKLEWGSSSFCHLRNEYLHVFSIFLYFYPSFHMFNNFSLQNDINKVKEICWNSLCFLYILSYSSSNLQKKIYSCLSINLITSIIFCSDLPITKISSNKHFHAEKHLNFKQGCSKVIFFIFT